MLKMNSKMLDLYRKSALCEIALSGELAEIASSGFKELDGCLFVSKLIDYGSSATIYDFPDRTGYECFINSVNTDDYVDNHHLGYGVSFVRKIFNCWHDAKRKQILVAMLLVGEFGVKVKLHVQRGTEQWLADDLESYEEPILVVDSLESEF